jgi:DNA excision repair protein ERCC-2
MKLEIHIGVRELVAHVLRRGDLEYEFGAATRALEAIRLHQRIQDSRPPAYRPEVTVTHRVATDRCALVVGGRIDGVFPDGPVPVVEEIKTTRRSLEECARGENPLHWGQAKTYAFLYALAHGAGVVGVQLTYARTDSGETREIRRDFTLAELGVFFDDMVARYLDWATTLADWRQLRDGSIRRLAFPYEHPRPGQPQMAAAVAQALNRKSRMFIQAATGIGKTMAVMFPAVKAIAAGEAAKVFYLTARTTGRLAAEKALAELRATGLGLKSLTLTAKDKICPDPDRECSAEECPRARGHFDRLPQARGDLFAADAWTRAAVETAAERHQVCPFEFALEMSAWADVVVCDYNYAFDPKAYLRRFFQEETADYAFLVDEAHNLVDRAREMFSAEVLKSPLLALRRALKTELPHLYRELGRINRWMLAARKRCAQTGAPEVAQAPPEDLEPLLRGFAQAAERWLEKNIKSAFRPALLERYFEIGGFLRVAEQFDETYAALTEALPADVRVKLFCMDPSRQIAAAVNRARSAVFFSATLAPLDYFKTMLGCEEAADLTVPSPFPQENLGVFVCDRVSTLYRHRLRTRPEVAGIVRAFVSHRNGNFLLFFPSYEYLRLVHAAFQEAHPRCRTLVQAPGMSERKREEFLAHFESDAAETLVGFAVMGGIFGEGIDLVGTRLSGAAIVGVGLPAVGLERELIRDYFARRLDQGYEYAYVYPGINRVLQAAGRVIRTETDRGVVLLIDQRYGHRNYRGLLPGHWQSTHIRDGGELARELERFWGVGPDAAHRARN